ncbi:AmmeMemoRadiSam system radical SAM enzyme [Variovorax sp. JS1663]|uniref:AmmeMemoRadiSam system radical SAM enzyme n=1 Tax=Variovorax sp. JS1663 TaxID=1851577 RepID=UPI00192CFD35|nr:AmmeMemoRadiSam system radical SAM enzyme [Variovorax sp. JS1663]
MSEDEQAAWPGRWWHRLDDGRIQCDLCPRDCRLHEGQRGLCSVRRRVGDAMVLTTCGRSSGFCIDPIEKKPLNHFHPGSSVLSFGTAGCNLACKFCQNWDISKSREMDRLMDEASPQRIARLARERGALSVAFTYNDPVIFAEYAMDAADACHALGLFSVAVTAGYMHAAPRRAARFTRRWTSTAASAGAGSRCGLQLRQAARRDGPRPAVHADSPPAARCSCG